MSEQVQIDTKREGAYSLVVGVDENDFIVLVNTILVDPVGVQDTEVAAASSDTLFSSRAETTLVLQVVNTLANGLAVGRTLGDGLLAVSTADTDTVDDIALLGLVSEAARLVGARRAGGTVDDVQLSVFPAANAKQETEDIRLLLLVELPDVLVGTHLEINWSESSFCRRFEGKILLSKR